jgi:hypothetical protein
MDNITYNQLPEEIRHFLGDSDEYKNRSYTKEDISDYEWNLENRRGMEKREKNNRKNYIKQKKVKMAENKRMFGREKCGFCFQGGTSSRLYLSHVDVKSCPTLAKAMCNKCGLHGHTRKHCKSQEDKRLRLPYKHNKRPQLDEWDDDDMCMTFYEEGDSEYWSDSEEEKERVAEVIPAINLMEKPVIPVGVKEEGTKEKPVKKSLASIVKKSV